MDIEKLIAGVTVLTNFIVGRTFWLLATIASLWFGFSSKLSALYISVLQSQFYIHFYDIVLKIVDAYSLNTIIPSISIFFFIFLLNAHRNFAVFIGRELPPSISSYPLVGFDLLRRARLEYVMRNIDPKLSVFQLQAVVRARFEEVERKHIFDRYEYIFRMSKFEAYVAVVSGVFGFFSGQTFYLYCAYMFIAFLFVAVGSFFLLGFHLKRNSFWAVEELINKIIAEHLSDADRKDAFKSEDEIKRELDEFFLISKNTKPVSLYIPIPFVGSMGVLRNYGGE
jgi:hypothetical protein